MRFSICQRFMLLATAVTVVASSIQANAGCSGDYKRDVGINSTNFGVKCWDRGTKTARQCQDKCKKTGICEAWEWGQDMDKKDEYYKCCMTKNKNHKTVKNDNTTDLVYGTKNACPSGVKPLNAFCSESSECGIDLYCTSDHICKARPNTMCWNDCDCGKQYDECIDWKCTKKIGGKSALERLLQAQIDNLKKQLGKCELTTITSSPIEIEKTGKCKKDNDCSDNSFCKMTNNTDEYTDGSCKPPPPGECRRHENCNSTSFCSKDEKTEKMTCMPKLDIGKKCVGDIMCANFNCNSTKQRCEKLENGECSDHENCEKNQWCDQDKNKCMDIPKGKQCWVNRNCADNEKCNWQQMCVPRLSKGKECNDTRDCANGLVCDEDFQDEDRDICQ